MFLLNYSKSTALRLFYNFPRFRHKQAQSIFYSKLNLYLDPLPVVGLFQQVFENYTQRNLVFATNFGFITIIFATCCRRPLMFQTIKSVR